MNYNCIALFTLGCLFNLGNLFAQNIGYEELCQKAVTENHTLKQKALDVQSAEKDVKATKLNRLPSLGGNVYSSLNNGRALDPLTYEYVTQNFFYNTGSLESRFMLYEGGRQSNTIEKSKNNVIFQELNLENETQNIRGKILAIYLNVLRLQEHQKLVQQQLDNNNQQKEKWKLLVKSGRTTNAALNEIQVESDRLSGYDQEITYKVHNELIKLQNLIGGETTVTSLQELTISEPSDTLGFNSDDLKQKATQSIVYQQTAVNEQLVLNNLQLAKGSYAPTVSLIGTMGSGYSSVVTNNGFEAGSFGAQQKNNYYKNIAINIYVPIFSKFQTSTQVQKAKIKVEQTKEQQSQTLNDVTEQLQQQNQLMVSTAQRYKVVKASVTTYEKVVKETQLRQQNGRANAFELLLKEQQMFTLKSNLIDLKYYHYLSKKNIELVELTKVTLE